MFTLQQDVVCTQYTPNYPGKELEFLEDYETAFVNIEAVSPMPLYSDEGKRQTFLANFSLINHTAEIIDILSSQTSTWEELTSSLHSKLACRYAQSAHEGKRYAHMATSSTDMHDEAVVQYYINTVSDNNEFNVGRAL